MTIIEIVAARNTAWKLEPLARLLECSRGKLYKMVKAGRMPYMTIMGMIRFDPAATAAWLANQSFTPSRSR
jgi:excisionase family DNA binding protein